MSEWRGIDFAPQGWQCPICKRVYSPTTPMCYYCGNNSTTVSSATVGDLKEQAPHKETFLDSLSEAELMEPMRHFKD